MKPILYIIAPLTADTPEGVSANIARANKAWKKLNDMGYIVICMHNLSGHWFGKVDEDHAMASCLRFLALSNVCCVLDGWESSKGSQQEIAEAQANGIPVYFGVGNVPPISDFRPDTTTLVIARHLERRRKGVETYGEPLRPRNGRDSLKDAIEEVADMHMYLENFAVELSGNPG